MESCEKVMAIAKIKETMESLLGKWVAVHIKTWKRLSANYWKR